MGKASWQGINSRLTLSSPPSNCQTSILIFLRNLTLFSEPFGGDVACRLVGLSSLRFYLWLTRRRARWVQMWTAKMNGRLLWSTNVCASPSTHVGSITRAGTENWKWFICVSVRRHFFVCILFFLFPLSVRRANWLSSRPPYDSLRPRVDKFYFWNGWLNEPMSLCVWSFRDAFLIAIARIGYVCYSTVSSIYGPALVRHEREGRRGCLFLAQRTFALEPPVRQSRGKARLSSPIQSVGIPTRRETQQFASAKVFLSIWRTWFYSDKTPMHLSRSAVVLFPSFFRFFVICPKKFTRVRFGSSKVLTWEWVNGSLAASARRDPRSPELVEWPSGNNKRPEVVCCPSFSFGLSQWKKCQRLCWCETETSWLHLSSETMDSIEDILTKVNCCARTDFVKFPFFFSFLFLFGAE